MIYFHVTALSATIALMLIITVIFGGCQVVGLPSQMFAGIYFCLSKRQFFFFYLKF